METNELLLHLTKKLESGEITLHGSYDKEDEDRTTLYFFTIGGERINIGKVSTSDKVLNLPRFQGASVWKPYEASWNNKFKENFYKEKGIKCWVKDCSNKVCIEKGDHEKLRLQCIDDDGFHRRIVCKECSETDYIHQLIDGVF